MQYPLLSEYRESILNAEDNLDKLSHLRPVLDADGEPVMSSGNFAVVFKMTDGKKDYAIKCFTKEQEGRSKAYQLIAEELESVNSYYITSIKYLEKELFVDSNCEENEFPVLLMDWIEGESMEKFIADNYQDRYTMSMLCYRFCKMAAWLRAQPFAHGDLKPDNIMIRLDGDLTLVDYDGMFVPAMKGQKSPTVGTKNFSHPLRTVDDFDETIDDLALTSIALSLKSISLNPSLYSEYCVPDRLLFSSDDYLDLSKSKVLEEVRSLLTDNEVAKLLSLFLLALSTKDFSMCSFRLFHVDKPEEILVISTKVTQEELDNAIKDEYGVMYSQDGKKLLKTPRTLKGSYVIRRGTQVVSDSAFRWCSSLESIAIPGSVTSIGERAFSGCSFLESIAIPNSVTKIGDSAFDDCSSLGAIVIPENVTSIGDGAFSSCRSLEAIVIPESVTSIGGGAFYECRSLEEVTIPDSVTCMNGNPFSGWHGILTIQSPHFCYENGILFDKKRNILIAYRSNSTICSVPDGVTNIGNSAFSHCSSLKAIEIPDSVTSIGDRAFSGCRSLKAIEIPNSVTSIGGGAFSGCRSLGAIVFPENVTSIGGSAFSSCRSLEAIVIPESVTSIGEGAFSGCSSLESIVIPESVTSIGDSAFSDCSSLKTIVIPDSVTSIGDRAFFDCSSLKAIEIPNSVTSIGDWAFYKCSSLGAIVIPHNVTSIGDSSFRRCTSLESIVIPEGVTCMTGNPFRGWHGILEIQSPHFCYENGTLLDKKRNILIAYRSNNAVCSIPNSVTNIGERAFSGCSSLESIVIPDSVTSIGEGAFSGCSSLESIEIPESVTSIGDCAFLGCSSLESIEIPESVTSIGNWTFDGCVSLNPERKAAIHRRFGNDAGSRIHALVKHLKNSDVL